MTEKYENMLRKIITLKLGSNDDTNYGVTSDRIDKWKEKREIETKKYVGILSEKRIIYYSDFYDLKNIIDKNWINFKAILGDKKRFEVFFNEVEKYRRIIFISKRFIKRNNSRFTIFICNISQ